MRLEITLKPKFKNYIIPVNYNYPISSAIYKTFAKSGPNFARWLHTRGFTLDGSKRFKFFTFSRLYFQEKQIKDNTIIASGNCRLLFSSPIDESIITNFVEGLLSDNIIFIGNNMAGMEFKIANVSIKPYPNFKRIMTYKMLSQTVLTRKNENNKIRYITPIDEDVEMSLIKNILNKYEIMYREKYDEICNITISKEYIEKKGNKIEKLVKIKEATKDEATIRGFLIPLTIEATPQMQKLIYDAGLGEKNSLGFGMVEVSTL